MLHLGDITKIKGCNAPVVDCIIGGSPCQDLSVAGKRAGLAGERSGLYMEQIRIIKEMRHSDEQRGRTGESVRPRYMVWENVPGAFSSNQGKDFAAVLEEAIKVAEPEAPNVPVPEKGWPTSGCIMGDTWSVAWRVLDAQFWGVPQRRRRIALVADFGGQSAPEILFVRKGVSRDLDESEQKRKATAGDAESGTGADGRDGAIGCDLYNLAVSGDKAVSLNTNTNATGAGPTVAVPKAVGFPLGFRPENVRCYDETATTLCNGTRPGFTTGVIQPICAVMGVDSYNLCTTGGVSRTLAASRSDNEHLPCVVQPVTLEPGIAAREGGHIYEGVSGTLRAKAGDNQMSVAYGIQGSMIGRADHNGPQCDGVNEDVSFTLNTTDRHAVAYNIGSYHSNAWKSDNPYSGVYEADKSKTLDALQCGYPGCNQGGTAVVEPAYCIGNGQVDQLGLSAKVVTLNCMHDQQAIVIDRAFFNQGQNALYEPRCYEDGIVPTLVAKGPPAVQVRYIVRRLTPLECERLQGYPDGWTDIGEWIDSKGKKHKEADSPRYKALGNSIAIPPWKWVLKKLCACYERDATMASLFDGIGGFPYIWEQLNGKGSCLWASEIEEFPMAVTKVRFGE